jgi:hypothetical protein
MIIEIITAIILIEGAIILSRLIGRRRDVFYYVSRTDDAQ